MSLWFSDNIKHNNLYTKSLLNFDKDTFSVSKDPSSPMVDLLKSLKILKIVLIVVFYLFLLITHFAYFYSFLVKSFYIFSFILFYGYSKCFRVFLFIFRFLEDRCGVKLFGIDPKLRGKVGAWKTLSFQLEGRVGRKKKKIEFILENFGLIFWIQWMLHKEDKREKEIKAKNDMYWWTVKCFSFYLIVSFSLLYPMSGKWSWKSAKISPIIFFFLLYVPSSQKDNVFQAYNFSTKLPNNSATHCSSKILKINSNTQKHPI